MFLLWVKFLNKNLSLQNINALGKRMQQSFTSGIHWIELKQISICMCFKLRHPKTMAPWKLKLEHLISSVQASTLRMAITSLKIISFLVC